MVTEFIDWTTVRQWSTSNGRFPLPLAADVAVQVLAGLDHIHRRGLLHRDISADNIMLSYDADERLVAKIIDLGIAKDVNTPASEMATQAGILIGNPKYMSPEQLGSIEDGEQLDGRADLYGLGVVLYEMLLGVPPFLSETPQGYIMKHLTQPPRRFHESAKDAQWPDGLEAVIFRALEKDRRLRYADAREMSKALQPFLTAPGGTLDRDDVNRIRRGPEQTMPAMSVVDTTEAKVRAFELSLINDIRAREAEGDRNALKRLAEAHPPGTPVGDAAREALTRVGPAVDDETAFQHTWETGTSAAWQQFIDAYPNSAHVAEATRCRQEAIDFEFSLARDTATMWRTFVKAWPDGPHRLDADIRLRAKKTE
jgi:serine/threonine protein kinase